MIDSENLGIIRDYQLQEFLIMELSSTLINWGILK